MQRWISFWALNKNQSGRGARDRANKAARKLVHVPGGCIHIGSAGVVRPVDESSAVVRDEVERGKFHAENRSKTGWTTAVQPLRMRRKLTNMKTLLTLCVLCFFGASYSQVYSPRRFVQPITGPEGRVHRTVTKEELAQRTRSIAAKKPLRIYGDRVFDLTELIIAHGDGGQFCETFWICGKVLSVLKDGLLISPWGSSGEVVCFRDFPGDKTAVDGQNISCAAFRSTERYQYNSASGALKTVPVYFFGAAVDSVPSRFTNYSKVWGGGGVTVEVISATNRAPSTLSK